MSAITPQTSEEIRVLKQQLLECQTQLRYAHEEHNSMLDNIDEMIWSIDTTSGIMHVSAACIKIFGYSASEMERIDDVWRKFVHPDDQKLLERSAEDLAQGKSLRKQYRVIHKDGSIKWLESKIIPTLGASGSLVRMNGITRDVTKEKKAQKALLTSEFMFRQFFDNAHEAILVLDVATGVICDYNQTSVNLFKYCNTEMLTQTPVTLSPEFQFNGELSAAKAQHYINETIAGKKLMFEWLFINREGREIPTEVRLSLITTHGRTLIRGSIIDITERKKAEMEVRLLNESLETRVRERTLALTEANNQLEAFNCTVSHDLQAPLRAVVGFSQLVLNNYSGKMDNDGREMLNIIHSSTLRMSRLIKELLEFAKLGKAENKMVLVDMDDIVKEVVDEVRFNQPQYKADILIHGINNAICDPALIKQVWVNLISNAIKYSSKKDQPKVDIGSEMTDGEIVYYVKDNGAGFDMKHAQKLFSIFKRLHGEEEFEGTGIGLATVNSIVSRQGGRVWAEAKPYQGATFYFTLPA